MYTAIFIMIGTFSLHEQGVCKHVNVSVDGDRHCFDWISFTSNVQKMRGSLSGDNIRLARSQ